MREVIVGQKDHREETVNEVNEKIDMIYGDSEKYQYQRCNPFNYEKDIMNHIICEYGDRSHEEEFNVGIEAYYDPFDGNGSVKIRFKKNGGNIVYTVEKGFLSGEQVADDFVDIEDKLDDIIVQSLKELKLSIEKNI